MTNNGNGDIVPGKKDLEGIQEEILEELDGCGEESKELIHRRILQVAESHSGPLPHPRILAQYKEVMEDAPERIFLMAEKQQDHRMMIEKSVVDSDIKRADRGLILGFCLFLVFGLGSILLLSLGKDIGGYSLLFTSVIGGIANFIRVGMERSKEKERKEDIGSGEKREDDKKEEVKEIEDEK